MIMSYKIYIRSLLLETEEPTEEGEGKTVGPRGMEDTRRTWPIDITKQGSHGLKETETTT